MLILLSLAATHYQLSDALAYYSLVFTCFAMLQRSYIMLNIMLTRKLVPQFVQSLQDY